MKQTLEEYLLEISVKGYAETTVNNQKCNIEQFINFTGCEVFIEDVKSVHIKKFIIDQQKKVKNSTINQRLKNLKTFFNFAVEEGLIESNPMEKIKLLKEDKNVIKTYSSNEVRITLDDLTGKDFLNVRNKTIITLLIETGVRNSELCRIKLQDVYEGSIRIEGKGSKIRFVPISKPLQLQLVKYMRVRNRYSVDSEYLFTTRSRNPLNRQQLLKIVKSIVDSESTVTVHQCRRWYAQQMLDKVNLYELQRLLGHSNISVTERYIQGIEDKVIIQKGMNSPLSNM